MPKRNTNVESGHENHQCQKGIKKMQTLVMKMINTVKE